MDYHPSCSTCLDFYSPKYFQQGFPDSLLVVKRDITIDQFKACTSSPCFVKSYFKRCKHLGPICPPSRGPFFISSGQAPPRLDC